MTAQTQFLVVPGSAAGQWIFASIFAALKNKTVAQAA
jgi:hypothetical protein